MLVTHHFTRLLRDPKADARGAQAFESLLPPPQAPRPYR